MSETVGKVIWIGLRPTRKAQLISVEKTKAVSGYGLEGDHYQKNGSREITIIQQEHLESTSQKLNKEVSPLQTRRNIVVKGIDLSSLHNQKLKIGTATIEITGPCNPCSRMEENLGPGGLSAMSGHGGITAKIIESGEIKIGDTISL